MVSSRTFAVLHFTFRSVIHFKLIFVKGFNVCVYKWLFQYHLLERPSFLPWIASILLSEVGWLHLPGSVSGPFFLSSTDLCVLSPISHCLDYCSFIGSLEVEWYQSSDFVLKYCAGYSGSFFLPIYFRINLSISTKYLAGVFIGIVLNLQIKLGKTDLLKNVVLET